MNPDVTSGTPAAHGKAAGRTRGLADGGGLARRHDLGMMWKQTSISLVRCRDCASALLQPLDVAAPIDGSSIVSRFCPDCGRRDTVVAEHVAVEAWLRRDERIAAWMAASADALAAELALTGVAPNQ